MSMSMSTVPVVVFNNGHSCPVIGFGTWLVLCALSFLATGSYQRLVGICSHLPQRTTSRCINQVVDSLNHPKIRAKWIVFPMTRQERGCIKQEFQRKFGLPGVIGCIDCTHVALVKPKEEEHLFYNRKGYHSLNVQMPEPVTEVVKTAIDVGFRHFDCAAAYENETKVGAAITDKIKEGLIKREDIFITSKLPVISNRPELVEVEIKNSLQKLGLEYLDLYMIHWPQSYEEGFNPTTIQEYSKAVPGNVDFVDIWKAMENVVDKGLAKSIGFSNFNKRQIGRVMAMARIKPAVLQIEVHPYLNQVKLIDYCTSVGIQVTACAPLGSPERPWAKPTDPVLFEDQRIKPIGAKYGKSLVQVLIRYAIERGLIVIPKSAIRYQIEENFNVFDFKLSPEDMKQLGAMECNFRFCNLGDVHHPEHPFNDEY